MCKIFKPANTSQIKNPNTKSFTWSQKSPRIFCRLDYWLISNNLNDLVKSTDIIPAIRTDHDAITLDIEELETELKGSHLCPGLNALTKKNTKNPYYEIY